MATRGIAPSQELGALFADYAAAITFESLPSGVVSVLKGLVLNTLSAALAASTMGEGANALVSWARRSGGAPESTILGIGDKVPAHAAAFVNGGMAHMINYDDSCAHAPVHLGPVTLPPALACAEMAGGVNGRDFLAAIAAGAETQARLGAALAAAQAKLLARPQPAQLHGYFAVAVTAGRIFKFNPDQMLSAMAFALMQSAGAGQPGYEGRPGKSVYLAFPNMGGMTAAMLAREGLRNECAVFEGEQGYFRTFSRGEFSRPALEEGLGEDFYLMNVGFKRWPTTGSSHAFIEAAVHIAESNDLDPAAISSVKITGPGRIRQFVEPGPVRRAPSSGTAAADSIIFAVAKALANRRVALTDFAQTAMGLFQPEALLIADMMEYAIDDSVGQSAQVEVVTRQGEAYVARVDVPTGHRDRPLSREQLREKFVGCAQLASHPVPLAVLNEVMDRVEHLEQEADVSALVDLLHA